MDPVGDHQADCQPEEAGADRQPGIHHPAFGPSRPQEQRDNRQRQQHHPGNAERRLGHGRPPLALKPQHSGLPKAVVNPSRA